MDIMKNVIDKIHQNEEGEEEATGPRGVKSQGPFRLRHVTNGQIRRARIRTIEAGRRKETKRYRRRFMDNRLAIAILRGQLRILATTSAGDREHRRIEKTLEERYGSVQNAQEHFDRIEAERALQRMGR